MVLFARLDPFTRKVVIFVLVVGAVLSLAVSMYVYFFGLSKALIRVIRIASVVGPLAASLAGLWIARRTSGQRRLDVPKPPSR